MGAGGTREQARRLRDSALVPDAPVPVVWRSDRVGDDECPSLDARRGGGRAARGEPLRALPERLGASEAAVSSALSVGQLVRIRQTSGERRVVELEDERARLVTVSGRPLPLEGGWYHRSYLEAVTAREEVRQVSHRKKADARGPDAKRAGAVDGAEGEGAARRPAGDTGSARVARRRADATRIGSARAVGERSASDPKRGVEVVP